MTTIIATITASAAKLEKILTQSALPKTGDPPWYHSDLYLLFEEDRLVILMESGAGSVRTYCTYEEDYFRDYDADEGSEAVLDVEQTLDYIELVEDEDGKMTLEFIEEDEESSRAELLRFHGTLDAQLALPGGEGVYDSVPEDYPERWTDDNELLSPSGNPHKCFIRTTTTEIQRIIRAVELDEDDYYPIAIRDGEFFLAIREGERHGEVTGKLSASEVKGEDFVNWYLPGFKETFDNALSGSVWLQTTPGGVSLAVVQESDDRVIRHNLANVNP